MKIDFAKIGKYCLELLSNNADKIVGIAVAIGGGLLCKKLNLPYSTVSLPNSNEPIQLWKYRMPRNSIEASIFAIGKSAINANWDSDKESGVRNILSILKSNENVDDCTKTFAISVISDISNSSNWSSTKDVASRAIAMIGKEQK